MRSNNGQVALIALLVLAVATTVGLAVISRGTTNVATTRNSEESTRAFSAAETGIEEALRTGAAGAALLDYQNGLDASFGTTYTTTVATVSGAANTPFSFPAKTLKGETETVWLVAHNTDGTLVETPTYTANSINVCWSGGTPLPAMVVTLLYKENGVAPGSSVYNVVKAAIDPDTARAAVNNFSTIPVMSNICGSALPYVQTITFNTLSASINPASDTLLMLRLRPVYADAQIAVIPTQVLPDQYNRIESVGQTASGTTRKIVVIKKFDAPSSIFDAAVYSQGSFVQQ